jgi:mannitol/fructose-specific phosphotransferase system IIA component
MDFPRPLLGAYGITVQGIDNGVEAHLVIGVAGRQEDNHVSVNRIAFEMSLTSQVVRF